MNSGLTSPCLLRHRSAPRTPDARPGLRNYHRQNRPWAGWWAWQWLGTQESCACYGTHRRHATTGPCWWDHACATLQATLQRLHELEQSLARPVGHQAPAAQRLPARPAAAAARGSWPRCDNTYIYLDLEMEVALGSWYLCVCDKI